MLSLRLLRLASLYQLFATALLGLGAALAWPDRATAVVLGGLVTSLNFGALRYLMHKTLQSGSGKAIYALALGMKLFVMLALLAVLLVGLRLDPVGVMVGLCTLFIGVGLAVAHQAHTTARAPSAPAA